MTPDRIAEGRDLREEVIALRDMALEQADFEWSVKLSHVIAWMAKAITELSEDRT